MHTGWEREAISLFVLWSTRLVLIFRQTAPGCRGKLLESVKKVFCDGVCGLADA
jgi:hypothetical protein